MSTMPSKKRKYNARFPAGRIKKIMQTDEEVGKVAQAVPIIISRTLELFVESLLGKAMQVTLMRNAKTLSPSHVKQCILGEARFDFLRDLVKNIPDVSAAEEKELMSGESSPNSSRCPEAAAPPAQVAPEDFDSSSSCDVTKVPPLAPIDCPSEHLPLALLADDVPEPSPEPELPTTSIQIDPAALMNIPTIIAPIAPIPQAPKPIKVPPCETAIDLSKKDPKPPPPNFYQETLIDNSPQSSVIKVNPIYSPSLPSTSYTTLSTIEPVRKTDNPPLRPFDIHNSIPLGAEIPVSPIINIDFSKNIKKPEILVLDAAAKAAHLECFPKTEVKPKVKRRRSKVDAKKSDAKHPKHIPVNLDRNQQIDEDYDT